LSAQFPGSRVPDAEQRRMISLPPLPPTQ
jgi:hypothetical protein